MSRRKRLSKRANKRNFSYSAKKVNTKNIARHTNRGGIRL